jgi:hypothetical protein
MQIIWRVCTRVVVLLGPYAIKIARVRIFGCAFRTALYSYKACAALLTGRLRERVAFWRVEPRGVSNSLLRAYVDGLANGLIANRLEYRRSKQSAAYDLAPTLFSLGYLVNVQVRGASLSGDDISLHPLVSAARQHPEMLVELQPQQFCRIGDTICLADYGDPRLGAIMETGARRAPLPRFTDAECPPSRA